MGYQKIKRTSYSATRKSVSQRRENPYLKNLGTIAKNYLGVDPDVAYKGDVSSAIQEAITAEGDTEKMEVIGEALRRKSIALKRQATVRAEVAAAVIDTAEVIGTSEDATNSRIREFTDKMTLNRQKTDNGDYIADRKNRTAFTDGHTSFQDKLKTMMEARQAKQMSDQQSQTRSISEGYRRELAAFAAGKGSTADALRAHQNLGSSKSQGEKPKGLLGGFVDVMSQVVK